MIIGALAWSLQACNSSNRNDEMDNSDSLYNNDNMDVPPVDTTGMGTMRDSIDSTNQLDTVGRGL
ncbi:hypothetical protein [Albibacterium bauzanense]|nr:hypothetical protein [Albibacterium bauzanense]